MEDILTAFRSGRDSATGHRMVQQVFVVDLTIQEECLWTLSKCDRFLSIKIPAQPQHLICRPTFERTCRSSIGSQSTWLTSDWLQIGGSVND